MYHSDKVAQLLQKQPDTLRLFEDYLTENEYETFLREIDGYMKRKRYEYSHWDGVCALIGLERTGCICRLDDF